MSQGQLKFSLYTPDRKVFEGQETPEVTLTGTEGQIQILPGHVNMVGAHEPGLLKYKDVNGAEIRAFVSTGFFEVNQGTITVMAENFEPAESIDFERAKKAEQQALDKLKEEGGSAHRLKYQRKLQRAQLRQKIAKN